MHVYVMYSVIPFYPHFVQTFANLPVWAPSGHLPDSSCQHDIMNANVNPCSCHNKNYEHGCESMFMLCTVPFHSIPTLSRYSLICLFERQAGTFRIHHANMTSWTRMWIHVHAIIKTMSADVNSCLCYVSYHSILSPLCPDIQIGRAHVWTPVMH